MVRTGLVPVDTWTPDDFIVDFWEQSQGWVTNRYWKRIEGSNITMTDVQGVAADSLIRLARDDYESVVASMDTIVTDRRMFWALLKRRLNWDLSGYLAANMRHDDSVDELEELPTLSWMRTNLSQTRHDPQLLRALVYRITQLTPESQMLLALYFYEEVGMGEIADIMGLSKPTISKRLHKSAALVLRAAIDLVDHVAQPQVPAEHQWDRRSADAWSRENYGVDMDVYLQYVAVHYRADVSYLVDMLRFSNGDRVRRGDTRSPRSLSTGSRLTDEQVYDIRRRIDAGEKYASIAEQYGIVESTISHIRSRRTYAWLPERKPKRIIRKIDGRWVASTNGTDHHYDTWQEAIAE